MGIEGKAQTSGTGDSVVARRGCNVVSRHEGLERMCGRKVGVKSKGDDSVVQRMGALLQYVGEKDKDLYNGLQEMLGQVDDNSAAGTPLKKRTRISLRNNVFSPGETKAAPSRAAAMQRFIGLPEAPQTIPKDSPTVVERYAALQKFIN